MVFKDPGKGNKYEKEAVEEQKKAAGSKSCKKNDQFNFLKAPTPSPAKIDSCNPFHNRAQDRTNNCKNCPIIKIGISKDRE